MRMSNTVYDFSESGVQDMFVQKQVAGEVSLIPGAVISGWFPWRILLQGYYTHVSKMPGIYRSRLSTCYKEGKKEPIFFNPTKLGDPPPTTSELIAQLHHSLLLQSPSLLVRSTLLWPIDRRPVVL